MVANTLTSNDSLYQKHESAVVLLTLIPTPESSFHVFGLFWIDGNPVWERVLITGGNGGDMILISIHNGDDFHRSLL